MVGEFKYLEAIKNNNVLFRVRQVKYGFNLNLNRRVYEQRKAEKTNHKKH